MKLKSICTQIRLQNQAAFKKRLKIKVCIVVRKYRLLWTKRRRGSWSLASVAFGQKVVVPATPVDPSRSESDAVKVFMSIQATDSSELKSGIK